MALNLKKQQKSISRFHHLFLSLLKKGALFAGFLCLVFAFFWLVYQYVPAFQDSVARVWHFILPFYERNGLLKTIGLVALILGGIWAFMEEQQSKKKDA